MKTFRLRLPPSGPPANVEVPENTDDIENVSSVVGATLTDALNTLGKGGGGGDLPLPDGTQAAPSLSFAADLDLGMYRKGNNLAGMVQSDHLGWEWGNSTVVNQDPVSPATVRYTMRGYQNPLAGVSETAFLYALIDPVLGAEQQAALYVDITAAQLDTYGPAIKVIHAGAGDGIYVAQFGNGSAYEAATWADGSRGYISTIQAPGLPNSTLFNAFWDQDDVPNFGMYYADRATANALTIRRRDASAAAGLTQIRLINQAGDEQPFGVYNDGSVSLAGEAASGGTPEVESPELRLSGSAFNGGADKEARITLKVVVSDGAGGAFQLRIFAELEGGGAVLLGQWHQDGTLDLQDHSLVNVATLQALANLDIYSTGAHCATLVPPDTDGETALLLRIQKGGVASVEQVTFGDADSGGSGFRCLRVPN